MDNNHTNKNNDFESLDLTARYLDTIEDRRAAANRFGSMQRAAEVLQRQSNEQIFVQSRAGTGKTLEQSEENQEEDGEAAKFAEIQAWYMRLAEPSMEQEIRYEKAHRKEELRLARVARQRAFAEGHSAVEENTDDIDTTTEASQNEYHVTGGDQDPKGKGSMPKSTAHESGGKGRSNRKKQNRISAAEMRKSQGYGLEVFRSRTQKNGKRKASDCDADIDPEPKKSKLPVGSLARRLAKQPLNFDDLFSGDMIAAAHKSAQAPNGPNMARGNKKTALTQLVASIPASDQATAKDDAKLINEASKQFTPSARSVGDGYWKIQGMKNSFWSYQLIGAGFMRERENLGHVACGGMLCDIMGFGKTAQALANIVDGKPEDPEDPVKTTLIVVPSHLVNHWMTEIEEHCEPRAIGMVLNYHARSRLQGLNKDQTIKFIQSADVVLTTYDEVRRSYPLPSSARGMSAKDEDSFKKWWEAVYRNEVGPLHRIKFHRIILDEGDNIKGSYSKVSIAVRALTGRYKWVLSGTPLHNRLSEFHPYFDFLGVRKAGSVGEFKETYLADETAKDRLINVVRSIICRRTHESTLFCVPVLRLPDIKGTIVEVTFCEAERVIYNRVFHEFVQDIISMPSDGIGRYKCFMAMIVKLRMCSSHPLIIQELLKQRILTSGTMSVLQLCANEQGDPEHPSRKITKWLLVAKKDFAVPSRKSVKEVQEASEAGPSGRQEASHNATKPVTETQTVQATDSHQNEEHDQGATSGQTMLTAPEVQSTEETRLIEALHPSQGPPSEGHSQPAQKLQCSQPQPLQRSQSIQPLQAIEGDTERLVKQFHEFMSKLHKDKNWPERLSRIDCPSCNNYPENSVITSCKHLYCEECYCLLVEASQTNDDREVDSDVSGRKPVCRSCEVIIEEAAYCGDIDGDVLDPTAAKNKDDQEPEEQENHKHGSYGMFLPPGLRGGRRKTADKHEADEDGDWIAVAGQHMPSAKLTKVRDIIASWIAQDPKVKIVVFSQWLGFVDILAAMCEKEKWHHTFLTGKMRHEDRDKSIKAFGENPDVRVLLASLKVGGTGLNLTMASKCILVDLWWNEAVENQAMCRLHRIGQEKDVEFIKLGVTNTIDTWLLSMQLEKTEEIESAIGKDVLGQRQTVRELLNMFGAFFDPKRGAFTLKPKRGERIVEHSYETNGDREVIELD